MTFLEYLKLREGGLFSTNGCPPAGVHPPNIIDPYLKCPGGGSANVNAAANPLGAATQPIKKMKKMEKK